jgi:predicted nuclease with TOPRIM domain
MEKTETQLNEKKTKNFNNDIIKNNIELKHKEEKREELSESIDKKMKESAELKEKAEELNRNNEELKQKIGKEQTDNELIRNRNKLLGEEYSALQSKYDFITANYDYTTNLKKVKVDNLKNLTQTNNLVNSTIDTIVYKIKSFKKANICYTYFIEKWNFII